MANAKGGRQVANHTPKQICYISILDPDNAKLAAGQAVEAKGDDGSKYEGTIVKAKSDHKKGVARLKCTLGPTVHPRDDCPDGMLTVTVAGGPGVDDVPVTYVNDTP
jgi:hypothetical protein